ncbi:MAG: DNA polymerase III subunit gamma/tau [Blastocatellia bacterium]
MSYQVIARKYRPQTFTDLTGQEHIIRTLGNALEQKRLHHAWIFSGARGTGKTTTARILAKGLNCHKGISAAPCLACPSCLEITAGNSLDVLEIDAASNTGVDNVRDVIINNIAIAPARDRYKVFVIDEVHMLSTSAFNALLKTLEEPPPHVLFIMATTELHKIPETILSRCQHFEFRHIPLEKMAGRLRDIAAAEKVTIDEEGLRAIARAGAGSLRDALSAFDQVIAFSGANISAADVASSLGLVSEKTLLGFMEAIATQNSAAILQLTDELDSRGYDLRNFTRELMAYLRHMLVIKSGLDNRDMLEISETEIAALKQLTGHFSEEDLVRFFHLLADTEKEIRDSPWPRFQLETGLIRLTHVARLQSVTELIARLESLTGPGNNPDGAADPAGAISSASKPAPPAPRPAPAAPPRQSAPAPDSIPQTKAAAPARPAESRPAPRETAMPAGLPEEPPGFADNFDTCDSAPPDYAPASRGAAPAQAPAHTAALTPETRKIVDELERLSRPAVVAALEEAESVVLENDRLLVTVRGEDAFTRTLRNSGALMQEIGERLFGRAIRLEILTSGQKPAQAGETPPAAALRKQSMDNPAVRMVVDKFRGEIIDVREPGG